MPLDTGRLHAALDARWNRVEVVADTDSTNAALVRDTAAPDRSVLVAEHQSAGRGRLDRTWESPPHAGLTFSVLVRPPVTLARWGWLPLVAGVAVHDAVRDAGADVTLKWPNDLLAARDGRKLAGILAQTAEDAAVIGVGLNVSTTTGELPVDTATSLALLGADVDRTDLLVALLTRLDSLLARWADCDGDAAACGIDAAYRERCGTLGRPVRIEPVGDDAPFTGDAQDLDELGRLVVRTGDGPRTVGAGEVHHLRPAR